MTAEPAAPKKPKVGPIQFLNQVRAETRKITWPSRKETWITSVMVLIMVVLASLFFWIVDLVLGLGAAQLIQIGR
ncbi:preprotein translocase subunit SecE [Peiella sedimenti]|uniref:preprotein translocase subunit SecE n=1 Tax=Peiella sedimenti TaxID=3061083 RepID=UPI0031380B7B